MNLLFIGIIIFLSNNKQLCISDVVHTYSGALSFKEIKCNTTPLDKIECLKISTPEKIKECLKPHINKYRGVL